MVARRSRGDADSGPMIERAACHIERMQPAQRLSHQPNGGVGGHQFGRSDVMARQCRHQQPVTAAMIGRVDHRRAGQAGGIEPAQPRDFSRQFGQPRDRFGLDEMVGSGAIHPRAGFADGLRRQLNAAGPAGRQV